MESPDGHVTAPRGSSRDGSGGIFCQLVAALSCCSQKSSRQLPLEADTTAVEDAEAEVQVHVEDGSDTGVGVAARAEESSGGVAAAKLDESNVSTREAEGSNSSLTLPAAESSLEGQEGSSAGAAEEREQDQLLLPAAVAAAEAREHVRRKCQEAASDRVRPSVQSGGMTGTSSSTVSGGGYRTPRKKTPAYKSSTSAGSSPKSVTSSTTRGSTQAQTSQVDSAPTVGEVTSFSSDDLSWVTKEKVMTLGDVEARPKTMDQVSAPLAWVIASVPAEADDDAGSDSVQLQMMKTSTTGTTGSCSVVLEATQRTGARVQVELEDGWRDVPRMEFKQMRDHLLGGEVRFTIQARKAMYIIDFASLDGATQTNAATGKKRSLRILDTNPNEASPADASQNEEHNNEDSNHAARSGPVSKQVKEQERLGPQSKRGGAIQFQLGVLHGNAHAEACFAEFAKREEEMCGEWAAFYHSYSYAALIYEVHAAFGKVLFKFNSSAATLPRILVKEFGETPGAEALMRKFSTKFASERGDHHPEFRAVAISVMCSLVSLGPEASPPVIFIAGYSQNDLCFNGVLEKLLESCYVPKAQIKKLASKIIALCEAYGLDVSQFGGKPCESRMAGHLLQVFIKRSLVDRLAYAAKPWGAVDSTRQPLSTWLNSDSNTSYGQARIVAHPKLFMHPGCVRMHVASADPKFHSTRQKFQEELTQLLDVVLGEPELRKRAVAGIHGGTLPAWWVDNLP
mmetsp:Transcript_75868/g.180257  ORF Transcript_75868/g.180257 Transcript_75868/m.180257 type:complete len:738 (+) Transcript_75868:104-2317(+)